MHGEIPKGSCAKADATGFVWTNMPGKIKFNCDAFPGKSTKMMYLWRDLGRGSKGRVFLACNSSGKACAVKFFLINYGTFHRMEGSLEQREAWRTSEMKAKLEDANRERDHEQ